MKVNEKTTLAKILEFGGTEEILAKFQVPCLGCPMAKSEMEHLNLGQICAAYGIDEAELQKELNSLVKKFTKK